MTSRQLKILALITMTIDHIGAFVFKDIIILRVIGRIAFPIFTFLYVESYIHTSNRKNLMIRTTIAAVLGQVLLSLSGSNLVGIFFLFSLGWIAFELIDKGLVWAVPLIMLTAEYFKVDYGWYGIATLVLFYLLRGKRKQQCVSFVLLTALFLISPFFDPSYWPYITTIMQRFFSEYWVFFIEGFAVLALIPIYFYNGQMGKRFESKSARTFEKYFYYVYYPVHIALLAILGGGL